MGTDKIDIELIKNIIDLINGVFDKNEDLINLESLYGYTSRKNIVEFLEILNTIKKTNISKALKIIKDKAANKETNNANKVIKSQYSFNKVFETFNELTDEDILLEFKLTELQSMYLSLYSKNPPRNKTKKDIINTIRNYIYTSNRANAFKL